MARKEKRVCIIPNCGRPRRTRGLCAACYQSASAAIDKGKTTDESLVENGLMLPKQPPRSPFTISLANQK